jgi:uncharacterized glyoxalase superfamily protein PhnB
MIRNRSVPSASVIPVLAYLDVLEATEWLCRAFGFRERLRIGRHRAQLVFGDGAVIVTQLAAVDTDPGAATLMPSASTLTHGVHVRVGDVRAHHEQAVRSGARIVHPPTDHPYGERQYTAEDPGGHRWTFSESIADVDPADWGGILIDHPAES